MSISIIVRANGISIDARIRDEALPILLKITQDYIDHTASAPETHASPPARAADVEISPPKTQEQEVRAFLVTATGAEVLNKIGKAGLPEKVLILSAWAEANGLAAPWKCEDIESAFAKAKESPPSKFSREINKAIKAGWIRSESPRTYSVARSGWNEAQLIISESITPN